MCEEPVPKHGLSVEVAGVEPASSGSLVVILRAQPDWLPSRSAPGSPPRRLWAKLSR